MIKKIFFISLTAAWLIALSIAIKGNPKLGNLLSYSSSALQFNDDFDQNTSLKNAPYGAADIGYDEWGVPHIFASTEESAAFAIGFAQAKDRLFQLEMIARTVKGRLCEVVGKKALKRDIFWRKFGLEKQAKSYINNLKERNPAEYLKYQAFADGVNSYINTMPYSATPIEFHLLDAKPSRFAPENMYYLIRYMSYMLNYDEDDLAFEQLRTQLPDTLLNAYFPLISKHALPIYPDLPAAQLPQSQYPTQNVAKLEENYPFKLKNTQIGSNNWCASSTKTVGGYPILCNDTHLDLQLPATWYEMHVTVNGNARHGFGLAGAPYIISGYNDDVAWGMTNATWNLVDFYGLKTTSDHARYEIDGKQKKFLAVQDTIYIKGAKAVYKTFLHSDFGVMDSIAGQWLAVNWIGASVTQSTEGACFAALERSSTAQEAFLGLQGFWQPPQNFVIADRKGEFGLVTAGAAAMHNQPSRGIIQATKTSQLVTYTKMASVLNTINPKKGYVFSANENQTTNAVSAQLNPIKYADSWRAKRINEFLGSKPKLDATDMKQLQLDATDLEYTLIKPILEAYIPAKDLIFMKNWQGNCDTNSVAATQFLVFRDSLYRLFNEAIAPNMAIWVQAENAFYILQTQKQIATTKGSVKTSELVQKAWQGSQAKLTAMLGSDPEKWLYKKLHTTDIKHVTGIEALSYTPFGSSGTPNTVNASSGGKNYAAVHGASMRTIIELKPTGIAAMVVLTGGQSGRFNSQNYKNQVAEWRQGKYHKIVHYARFDAKNFKHFISFN